MSTATPWPWEQMAQSNARSHELLLTLLQPRPRERWLDVGTGSGGVALRAARAGAEVVGLDISAEAVKQARASALDEGIEVRFVIADARAIPFDDAAFDVVASAFGVNFSPDHAAVARELARVCKPGGRLGLTLMPLDSRTGELWTLLRGYGVADGDHPASFAERVDELLGPGFELEAELRTGVREPEPAPEEAWEFMKASFGPLSAVVGSLDGAELGELRRTFLALRARWAERAPTYLLVLGRRR